MQHKAEQFADVLRQHGVPVHRDSGTGYFDSMEIRDMLALLALLDNAQQDVPLAAVLRSPLSGIAAAEDALARIRLAYPGGGARTRSRFTTRPCGTRTSRPTNWPRGCATSSTS